MGDYHVHLHPHEPAPPGSVPPGVYPPGHIEGYVEAAAARGAAEVGFTEHLYRCVESADALGPFWDGPSPDARLGAQSRRFVESERNLSLEGYVAAVVAARERGLPVLLGLEVDYFPETIDSVLELLAPYPFDFLIGSVHWVGPWAVDHEDAVDEFERRGVRRSYEDYFTIAAALAGSGAVDVLAHVDVVKKHGRRLADDPLDLWAPVVKAAAASGVAVEVSSAGLYQAAAEIYPAPRLLGMFADARVPITFASDAHFPADAARGWNEVTAAARSAGYRERLRFRQRMPHTVPIGDVDDG